jgi:hypothetical protein
MNLSSVFVRVFAVVLLTLALALAPALPALATSGDDAAAAAPSTDESLVQTVVDWFVDLVAPDDGGGNADLGNHLDPNG